MIKGTLRPFFVFLLKLINSCLFNLTQFKLSISQNGLNLVKDLNGCLVGGNLGVGMMFESSTKQF